MDKIGKAFKKLNVKEKKRVEEILKKIYTGNFLGIDVKKLRGSIGIFRAKKGPLRIIYRKEKNREIFILTIERRSEKTYNKF